jgi:hypothetical protein
LASGRTHERSAHEKVSGQKSSGAGGRRGRCRTGGLGEQLEEYT